MKYLARQNLLGITILCLRFVPILFLGCMPHVICSAPWLVQFTIRVLHVVPRILHPLAYCESLLFTMVGIVVCICNQTIHRYVCMPICGDGLFIVRVDLCLLLLAGAFYPTVGGGSLYIHCIIPQWSGSRQSVFISLHFWLNNNLRELTGIWYTWLSWPFKLCWCFILHDMEPWVYSTDFTYVVISMKSHIISLSLFFFIGVFRMELQPYTYITYIYIHFLYCMWLGSVCISWSKCYLLVLYVVPR